MIPSFKDFSIINQGVNRRSFLKGVGATGAFLMTANWSWAQLTEEKKYGGDAMPGGTVDQPKLFIAINEDGSVEITVARAEMGQGIKTSLALVVAEELEADWDRCRVTLAPGDQATYGNQNTDGSRSMRHWYQPMRRCGATARTMLEQAAADQWQVPVTEVKAANHVVSHAKTGRSMGFGELASLMETQATPDSNSVKLKDENDFRYIGKDQTLSADGMDIVSGKAIFGADVRFDDMLYAVIARPPVFGSKAESWDDTEALKIKGVLKVIAVKGYLAPSVFNPLGGLAVVAENTWAAIKGREALKVEWSSTANDSYESGAFRQAMEAAAKEPGALLREAGDLEKAFTKAHQKLEATYYAPHLAHASMEPPVAIAILKDDFLEAWAPAQDPQSARSVMAAHVGFGEEKTKFNQTLLGGAFGRKAFADYVCEAAELAVAFPGRAVRVQWTREDDIRHDFYHTVSIEHLEASLDTNGTTTGWLHRSVAPSIFAQFMDTDQQNPVESNMGHTNIPFDVPNLRIENPAAKAHSRVGWFRSVSNIPRAFAVQSFISEMAEKADEDHLEFYLKLIGKDRHIHPHAMTDQWNHGESPELYPVDTRRLRQVARTAAKEAGWGKGLPAGRGMGLAVHYSFVSYVAVVLEVEVGAGGELIVHNATIAIDCGKAVNPDRVRSQMEGSCVMGIGLATTGEISFKDGAVVQSNFHDFEIPRITLAPKAISVHIVDPGRKVELGGVGEPGLPPIAPALCNAIHAATGKRIRSLPIRDQLA
ncbi:MAG: isoquinoline 1-oxidoreductase beta subunit [Lysobacterales bacterium]|jgi:isoquinoline 1-oxidoreductase beta subunit